MSTKTTALSKRTAQKHTKENSPEKLDTLQRAVSLTTGAVMLIRAVKNRSLLRGVGAGYLLYRGATGNCPVSDVIGQDVMDLNPLKA